MFIRAEALTNSGYGGDNVGNGKTHILEGAAGREKSNIVNWEDLCIGNVNLQIQKKGTVGEVA